MGDEGAPEDITNEISTTVTFDNKMTNLRELNKDFALNVPSIT